MTDPLPQSACPDCGTLLPADSPQALCPACLMRQALASRTLVNGNAKTSAPAAPPSPEEIADKFPQFEILQCLGRGGMGVVYKARQKSLNRIVAIKILAPERVGEGKFAERFTIEAELLAKLSHPHIVTIHDFGVTDSQPSTLNSQPLYYLVMEFIDGVNLRDLLRDGKLEAQQALAIVPPICEALQYAHDKGIVHRDIKPENLLLDRDGRIKIADFGIAALIGAGAENIGTPAYMAPEQSGASIEVDSRADIYALGVVLYEMLTGERPNKDIVAPSRKVRIDVRLDEIVLRALEKTPELRYQTAGEFRTVLETMVAEKVSATGPSASSRQPVHPMTKRVSIGRVILGCVVFGFFMAIREEFHDVWLRAGMAAVAAVAGFLVAVSHRWIAADPTTNATPETESRFSRTAILGAFFAVLCMSAMILQIKAFGIAATAVVTTLLGWIAVTEIRRSAGKLHGMWLAVFDGLLFPLLAMNALLIGLPFIACKLKAWPKMGSSLEAALALLTVTAIAVATVLDTVIIRRVWRAVNRPIIDADAVSYNAGSQETPAAKPTRRVLGDTHARKRGLWILFAVLGMVAVYTYQEWRFKYKAFGDRIKYGQLSPANAYAELLASHDKDARDACLEQIVDSGMQSDPVIIRALERVFGGEDPLSIPPMAALAMNRFNLPSYLHHPDSNQRLAAVFTSRRWKWDGKVEMLVKYLDDPDQNVVGQAVCELGYIGDSSVLPLLAQPRFDNANFINEVRAALKNSGNLREQNHTPMEIDLDTISVEITGPVARPGTHSLPGNATLLDALAAAGGWTGDANLHVAISQTDGKQNNSSSQHDLKPILEGRAVNPYAPMNSRITISKTNP